MWVRAWLCTEFMVKASWTSFPKIVQLQKAKPSANLGKERCFAWREMNAGKYKRCSCCFASIFQGSNGHRTHRFPAGSRNRNMTRLQGPRQKPQQLELQQPMCWVCHDLNFLMWHLGLSCSHVNHSCILPVSAINAVKFALTAGEGGAVSTVEMTDA